MKRYNVFAIIFAASLLSLSIFIGCEKDEEEDPSPPPPEPKVNVIETDGETVVTEDGLTDTYTINLNTQPTGDVTITLTTDGQTTITTKDEIIFLHIAHLLNG